MSPRRLPPWSWVAAGVIVALTLAVQLRTPLNSDIGFLLSTARRVAGGEVLYRDILEINPPLIVWLKIPVILLADALGAREAVVFTLLVTLLALGSAAASAALVTRTTLGRSPRALSVGVPVLLGVLLLFPGGMFGQREHLTIILALPLVLLTGLRAEAGRVSPLSACAAGAAAAVGIAIKPHFAVMYLLLLVYRLAADRREGRRLRLVAEDWVIGLSGAAYVAAVVLLTPEYFQYVGRVGEIYFGFARRSVATILFKRLPAIWVYVALAIWWVRQQRQPRQEPLGALAAAAVGAVLAVVLQHKGWSYHFYPSTVLAVLLATGSLVDAPGFQPDPARRGQRRVAALLLAVYALVLGSRVVNDARRRIVQDVPERQAAIAPLLEAVRRQEGARSILVLSSEIVDAYPVVNESRLADRASFPYMWVFTWEYSRFADDQSPAGPRPPAEMPPMERFAFERVASDLVDGRPDVLLAETPDRNRERVGPPGLDYLELLGQDPRVARALEEYRQVDQVEGVRIFRRQGGR